MISTSIATFYSAYKIKQVNKTSTTLSLVCRDRCNTVRWQVLDRASSAKEMELFLHMELSANCPELEPSVYETALP